MASLTLTLSGNQSILKTEYFPPIELGNGVYVCGLIDFQTFNSIPNINRFNNQFHYIENNIGSHPTSVEITKSDERDFISAVTLNNVTLSGINLDVTPSDIDILAGEKTITIPTGSYEIKDINNFLQRSLGNDIHFMLKVNNNTLKSEILCNRKINFKKNNTIGPLLGFSESDKPVNILKVNAIRIECNITTGAYANNKLVHTIHEFFPIVSPGYKIVEVPKNVIYLPVTVKTIHNLNISIVDQDGDLVDFRGETITIRLHLKRISE